MFFHLATSPSSTLHSPLRQRTTSQSNTLQGSEDNLHKTQVDEENFHRHHGFHQTVHPSRSSINDFGISVGLYDDADGIDAVIIGGATTTTTSAHKQPQQSGRRVAEQQDEQA
jgi:hypothetical protein